MREILTEQIKRKKFESMSANYDNDKKDHDSSRSPIKKELAQDNTARITPSFSCLISELSLSEDEGSKETSERIRLHKHSTRLIHRLVDSVITKNKDSYEQASTELKKLK